MVYQYVPYITQTLLKFASLYKLQTIANCVLYLHILYTVVKPKITGTSPEQTVISSSAAVFHCNVTAKPVATIKWLRDGSTLLQR